MTSMVEPSVGHDFSSSSARSLPLLLISFMRFYSTTVLLARVLRRIPTPLLSAEDIGSTQSVRTKTIDADTIVTRDTLDPTPPAWFLPGPIRIRGGLARHFSSDWLFHRGIHLEATPAALREIVTQFQNLTRQHRWPEWIPFGSQGIHLVGSFGQKSHLRKPPSGQIGRTP